MFYERLEHIAKISSVKREIAHKKQGTLLICQAAELKLSTAGTGLVSAPGTRLLTGKEYALCLVRETLVIS